MELYLQVREARRQANLTQGELAEAAGVGRKDVWRLENGANVTMQTFLKIVNALPDRRVELLREHPAMDGGEDLRQKAERVLEEVRKSREDEAAGKRQPAQETSLLRMFAELLLEITGGRDR